MLQCTAYTEIPEIDAFVALTAMEGGPDYPPDVLAVGEFLLCELGEHDDHTEHAAQLWTADTPAIRDLWLFWSGAGALRRCGFAGLPPCPASTCPKSVRHGQMCMFYVGHPAPHSWEVTDPLGSMLDQLARSAVRQKLWDDQDDGA